MVGKVLNLHVVTFADPDMSMKDNKNTFSEIGSVQKNEQVVTTDKASTVNLFVDFQLIDMA